MADKFRNTYPISISFSDGELPTAAKLTAIARQAKTGQQLIEYALGDLLNQSGDKLIGSGSSDVSANALMIPSLARFLGASKLVNPRIPKLSTIQRYVYRFTSTDVGNYEATLTFPVLSSASSYTWSGTAPRPTGAPVASADLVIATTQWYVDKETGRAIFFDPIQSDWELEYQPVVDGDLGEDHTFNVIPDPDTHSSYAFQGVKLQYVNGTDSSLGYYIFLPPRGPLNTRTTNKSPQDDIVAPAHSGNFQSSPSVGNRKFWQADSVDADTSSNAEHYRYVLPTLITDSWSQAAILPRGLLYLWDSNNTGTVIDGVIFAAENTAVPRKYVLVATSGNLDNWLSSYGSSAYPVANLQSSSQAASMYPSTGLKLITIGSSVGAALSSLIGQFINHDHSNSNSMPGALVEHAKLKGLFSAAALQSSSVTGSPIMGGSALDNDDHPQYLHRTGVTNDRPHLNAMMGDFMLANTQPSGGSYSNRVGDSHKIKFASSSTGPRLFYQQASDALVVDTRDLMVDSNRRLRIGSSSNFVQLKQSGQELSVAYDSSGGAGGAGQVGLAVLGVGGVAVSPVTTETGASASANSGRLTYSTTASSTQIYSPLGRLALAANTGPTAPDQATGGALYANHIRQGNKEDATYGWSGSTPTGPTSPGYGPVRYHVINPVDLKVFMLTSSTAGSFAEPLDYDGTNYAGVGAGIGVYDYSGSVPRGLSALLEADSGGIKNTFAVAPVNLPFTEYAIVNVQFAIKPRTAGLSASQLFMSIVSFSSSVNSVYPQGTLAAAEVDLHTRFGSATVNVWSNDTSVYSVSTATPTFTFTPFTAVPYLYFRLVRNDLEIGPINILYRIKEF